MTSLGMPICLYCTHYQPDAPGDWYRCAAFPSGIPLAIIESRVDHRLPVDGDQGIRFEPDCERGAEYAAETFGDVEAAETEVA